MSFKGYMGDYGMTGSEDDDDEGDDSPEEEEEEEVKESAPKKQKTEEKEKFDFESLMKFGYKPPKEKNEKQKRDGRAALDPHVAMLKGTVKYWDSTKGFGFISPKEDTTLNPDSEEDVFCHISEFPDCLNKSVPEQGAHVLYQTSKQMKDGRMKVSAIHVRYDTEAYKEEEAADAAAADEEQVTESFPFPEERKGVLIGRNGASIQSLQKKTRTHIELEDGKVIVEGAKSDVARAIELIRALRSNAEERAIAKRKEQGKEGEEADPSKSDTAAAAPPAKRLVGMQTKAEAIAELKRQEEDIAAKKKAKSRVSIYIAQKPMDNKKRFAGSRR